MEYIPIKVKWTDSPKVSDIKHLELFLSEYRESEKGYLVCRIPRRQKLSSRVVAIPWQEVDDLVL